MVILTLSLLGLCLGSFVNAAVWRLREQDKPNAKKGKTARDLSILKGRSMCPRCRHPLAAADLVPVVSWLSLGGKCRYCHKPISWQYPLVELLNAALFVVSWLYWPYGFGLAGVVRFGVWLILLSGFTALAVYDLHWFLLPNRIIYPLLVLATAQLLFLSISQDSINILIGGLLGLICAGGLFYILFQVSKGQWIGGGDVKLGFLLGLVAGGPAASLLLLFLASLLGSLVALPLLLTQRLSRRAHIPFGPFLLLAAVIVQLFGASLIAWYKRRLLLA